MLKLIRTIRHARILARALVLHMQDKNPEAYALLREHGLIDGSPGGVA